jgi:asparagine synthase (glutamine-hydrolysing)
MANLQAREVTTMSSWQRVRQVRLQARFGWQESAGPSHVLAWAGTPGNMPDIVAELEAADQTRLDLPRLMSKVEAWPGHFACILESANYVLAFVDRVRSYPIVYRTGPGVPQVSNSPYDLDDSQGLVLEETSCLELETTNYVSGARTLYRDVMQLQPGEAILFCKDGTPPVRCKYTSYLTEELAERTEGELIEEHDAAVSAIFRRIVDDAAGREIWIPLSAGLDSRLVLAKLKSLGYERLRTFSYGPPGNDDACGASRIARELGVPWTFVAYEGRAVRDYFWSEERRKYWRYASCGVSVPFMVDEVALRQLVASGQMADPAQAIIINGQSGDFISGGHLLGKHLERMDPDQRYSLSVIVEGILKKHYAQRPMSDDWKREFSRLVLEKIGADESTYRGQELAKLYEFWEAEERQAKYVVNGQRSYDYIGLQWRLPLWDRELFNFWRAVPYRFKTGQSLYKAYLRATNPCGMFRDREFPVENFHGWGRVIFPVARMVGLLAGTRAKNQTYRLAAYFGKYSNHYAPYGFGAHLRDFRRLQSPLGRYAETLLEELRS